MKHQFRSGGLTALLWLQLATIQPACAQQQPFAPKSDDEVLLVLPKSFLKNRDELSRLQKQLNADPANPEKAAEVASEYLSLGKRSGDPRFYGYARAAISRWWDTDASTAILQIRAKLKENDHLFDDALVDLKAALAKNPNNNNDNVQILTEIGNIYRTQGRYDEGMEVGDQLQSIIGPVPAAFCRAPIMAQTGQAEEAYNLLTGILPKAKTNLPSSVVQYLLTIRAEIADVLGREDEVEKHFVEGIQKAPGSFYLLRGYGDYLLDHDKADQALALLRDHTADNGVLLRAAIAADQSGQSELAQKWTDELETRFKEISLRGGEPHGRYESRFLYTLKNNPETALDVALKNWQKKKEVRDTRNVLEAAIAAGRPNAAEPVIEFLRANKNEHVTLNKLVKELESLK